MAFIHGKNAQFFVRDITNTWRNLTSYTGEVTLPGKSQAADTTIFGQGAKTYISGLIEGTATVKGFYDPTTTSGPDAVFAGLLGGQATTGFYAVAQVTSQSNNGQFQLYPNGSASADAAHPVKVWDAVITDYQIMAPVGNVVNFTVTMNISGGKIVTTVVQGAGNFTPIGGPTGTF